MFEAVHYVNYGRSGACRGQPAPSEVMLPPIYLSVFNYLCCSCTWEGRGAASWLPATPQKAFRVFGCRKVSHSLILILRHQHLGKGIGTEVLDSPDHWPVACLLRKRMTAPRV
eukprot:TRINITY_DN19280_c0_g1_i10.p1 TRINITY_DN19280_c0_g1~~TRINITY_DN19280_c0_g1_i10.p1  ORF type:complete len:113 (-),score=1.30 TRINITY_DN19280_c0_g1_i10:97-435(-)